MNEMIQTERDYVRSLEFVINHYIPELSRDDVPPALRGKRNLLFGNVEKIYEFNSRYFMAELETCAKNAFQVAHCFLRHVSVVECLYVDSVECKCGTGDMSIGVAWCSM